MRKSSRSGVAVVAICAAAILFTACSSSSKSGGSSGAGSTAGAAGAGSGVASPAGAPILIGGAGPINSQYLHQPERKSALEAAADGINAAGGINGHPVQVKFCDTKYDANQELACMRELIADHVSAIMTPGNLADQTGRGLKAASQAGVPVIGGQGLSPLEFSTPGVFPIASGIPGWAYGSVAALLQSGAKKIGLFGTTEPGSVFIIQLSQDALKAAGVTPTTHVAVDEAADPTFASGAAKVIQGGVDGIVVESAPNYIPKEVGALRQAGYKGPITSISGAVTTDIIKAMGSNAEGLLLTSQVAIQTDSSPAVGEFLADMKKYAPDSTINETAETTYAAVKLFAKVMANATSFTAADVLKTFNSLSTPVDIGLIGPFAVVGHKTYLEQYPQIYNPDIENGIVKNGVLVGDGKGLINPFDALASLKTS